MTNRCDVPGCNNPAGTFHIEGDTICLDCTKKVFRIAEALHPTPSP